MYFVKQTIVNFVTNVEHSKKCGHRCALTTWLREKAFPTRILQESESYKLAIH